MDFFSSLILGYVNKSISLSTFTSNQKLADIYPVYNKNLRYEKSNYRPINVLPILSKIFENVLYDQIISSFFEKFFSEYQTGLQKGFNLLGCLVAKIKKKLEIFTRLRRQICRISYGSVKSIGLFTTQSSFHAYRFDKASLSFMHNYFTDIKKLKSTILIVFGPSLNVRCHKVQFRVQFYLINFYVICSS